jgi:hypothetical protein
VDSTYEYPDACEADSTAPVAFDYVALAKPGRYKSGFESYRVEYYNLSGPGLFFLRLIYADHRIHVHGTNF